MSIDQTIQTLKYYKDVLQTDFYLPYFFQKKQWITSYQHGNENEPFLFVGLSNSDGRENFKNIFINLIEKKKNKSKLESIDILNLYYSPIMIEYKSDDNSEPLYIAPFFIELKIDNIETPFTHMDNIINFFENNENLAELFTKNLFFGKEVILNPAMLVEPFEFMSTNIYENIINIRKNKSKDMTLESMKNLVEFMLNYANQFSNKQYKFNDVGIKENRGYVKNIREKIITVELLEYLKTIKIKKNITVLEDGFVFAKNNTVNHQDDTMINGLLKVYEKVFKDGIEDDNLLNIMLSGNIHKYSPVPFDNISIENTTVKITTKLINQLTKMHLGALSSEFDLTPSQKYCLNMTNTTLPIIPVNGPPGTGKTSLLRAIVGDITVKNALGYYAEYRKGKDVFDFKTPIVSFSTNNRALDNIIEGILEAFDQIQDSQPEDNKTFTERWVNPEYMFSYFSNSTRLMKKGTINDIRLFIPKIKNSSKLDETNPKYPIFETKIQSLAPLINSIKQNPKKYILYFLEQFNKYFKIFDDINIAEERLEDFLKQAIDTIYKELKKHQAILDEKNSQLEYWLQSKIDVQNEIKKLTVSLNIELENIITSNDYKLFLSAVNKNIAFIDNVINEYYKKINTVNKIKDNKEVSILEQKLNRKLDIQSEFEYQNNALLDKVLIYQEKRNKEKQKIINQHLNLRDRKLNAYKEVHKKKNMLGQVFSKLFGNYQDEINQINADYKELCHKTNFEYEKKLENYQKVMLETFETNKKKEKQHLDLEIKMFEKKLENNQLDYNSMIQSIKEDLRSSMFGFDWEFNTIGDIEIKLSELKNNLSIIEETNKFFYDEYEKAIDLIYKNVDKEVRTLIFWNAQHLQESLLLYELLSLSKNKNQTQKCFKCKSKDSVVSSISKKGNLVFKCKKCDFIFTNTEKTFFAKRSLYGCEIRELFEFGYFNVGNQCFTLETSKDDTNNFWNITPYGNSKKDKIFNYLSVVIPIVNTTCHSFGTTMPIEEKSIDYLFIDEAGMVLTPYIINLYTGKKVFIFGDEKQIEPVYPLSLPIKNKNKSKKEIDRDAENPIEFKTKQEEINYYLIKKNIDKGKRNKIDEFQSAIKASIMSLANRSVFIYNDYIQREEIGDLWLTEHFRCKDSIIEYCNEHIYNNMMILMNKDKEDFKHISLLNSDSNQSKSNNGSKYNKGEADLIIQDILDRGKNISSKEKNNFFETIGVISPYKAQANTIIKLAKNNGIDNLTVGTVHAFQGSERNIIYLSTTVGKDDTISTAFFNQIEKPNIINVAVSRAKNEFILVGNEVKLAENPDSLTAKLVYHINQYNHTSK